MFILYDLVLYCCIQPCIFHLLYLSKNKKLNTLKVILVTKMIIIKTWILSQNVSVFYNHGNSLGYMLYYNLQPFIWCTFLLKHICKIFASRIWKRFFMWPVISCKPSTTCNWKKNEICIQHVTSHKCALSASTFIRQGTSHSMQHLHLAICFLYERF